MPKYKDDKLVFFFMNYLNGDYSEGKNYYMNNPYEFLDSLLNDSVDDLNSYMNEYLKNGIKHITLNIGMIFMLEMKIYILDIGVLNLAH